MLDQINTFKKVSPEHFVTAYALATIPARYALERGRWTDAANIAPHPREGEFAWEKFPQAVAEMVYARALGAGRSGDAPAVRKAIDRLQSLREAMIQAKIPYWPQRASIEIKVASAWAAYAEGNKQAALALMREGADMEDASDKHPVTPGQIIPARELLGELLLELGQPAAALKEFEASRMVEPNRFRGLLGAAHAAELAGDKAKAKDYYADLLKLTAKSDGQRPELMRAKEFLAKN